MPNNNVSQIKDCLTIEEVVSSYIKLERAGKNLKARCPFHNEKTPSFFVSPDRGMYHCFGCSRGGDMFSFVEEYEGVDFSGALKLLADRAGVPLTPVDPKIIREKERLYQLLEEVKTFFEQELAKEKNAQQYLRDRGVTEALEKQFHLGFAPGPPNNGWRTLYDTFTKKGYTEEELQKVGVIKRSEKGRWYDTFRSRIMFPIADNAGRTVAFSGRLFGQDNTTEAPKYLNTPETTLFNKGQTLYPLWRSKQGIRRYDFTIVVEGQMDVLLAHREKYHNTVAPLGTALTKQQLNRLKQLSVNLLLAFDADTAGMLSFKKAALLGLQMGFDVKVVSMPADRDPADIILADSDDWKRRVKEAVHAIDYLLVQLKENSKDERAYKKNVSRDVLPLVAHIESKIDQAHFVKKIAETMSVPEVAIYDELGKVEAATKITENALSAEKDSDTDTPRDRMMRELVGILLWQEAEKNTQIDTRTVRDKLDAMLVDTDVDILTASYETDELLFEVEERFSVVGTLERYVTEALLNLERIVLEERRVELGRRIRDAEQKHNDREAEKVAAETITIAKRIDQLKQEMQNVV